MFLTKSLILYLIISNSFSRLTMFTSSNRLQKKSLNLHKREFTVADKRFPQGLWVHVPEDYDPSKISSLRNRFNIKAEKLNLGLPFHCNDGQIFVDYADLLRWQNALKNEVIGNDKRLKLINNALQLTSEESQSITPKIRVNQEEKSSDFYEVNPLKRKRYEEDAPFNENSYNLLFSQGENLTLASNPASFWTIQQDSSPLARIISPENNKENNEFLTAEHLKQDYNQLSETQKVLLSVFCDNPFEYGLRGSDFLKLSQQDYFLTKYTEHLTSEKAPVDLSNG